MACAAAGLLNPLTARVVISVLAASAVCALVIERRAQRRIAEQARLMMSLHARLDEVSSLASCEVGVLREEVESLRSRGTALASDAAELRSQLAMAQESEAAKDAAHTARARTLEESLTQARQDLGAANQHCASVAAELEVRTADWRSRNADLDQRLQESHRRAEAMAADLETARSESTSAAARLEERTAAFETSLRGRDEQIAHLRERIAHTQSSLEAADADLKTARSENTSAAARLEERSAAFETTLRGRDEQIAQLSDQRDRLGESLEAADAELESARSDAAIAAARLEERATAFDATLVDRDQQIGRLNHDLADARSQRDAADAELERRESTWRDREAALLEAAGRCADDLGEAQRELAAVSARLADLTERHAAAETDHESQIQRLRDEVNAAQEARAATAAELEARAAAWNERLSEVESHRSDLLERCNSLNSELQHAKADMAALNALLEEQSASHGCAIEQWRDRLSAVEQSHESARADWKERLDAAEQGRDRAIEDRLAALIEFESEPDGAADHTAAHESLRADLAAAVSLLEESLTRTPAVADQNHTNAAIETLLNHDAKISERIGSIEHSLAAIHEAITPADAAPSDESDRAAVETALTSTLSGLSDRLREEHDRLHALMESSLSSIAAQIAATAEQVDRTRATAAAPAPLDIDDLCNRLAGAVAARGPAGDTLNHEDAPTIAIDTGARDAEVERLEEAHRRRETEWYEDRRAMHDYAEGLRADRNRVLAVAAASIEAIERRLRSSTDDAESGEETVDSVTDERRLLRNEVGHHLAALSCLSGASSPSRIHAVRVFDPVTEIERVMTEVGRDLGKEIDISFDLDDHLPEWVRGELMRVRPLAFFLLRSVVLRSGSDRTIHVGIACSGTDEPSRDNEVEVTMTIEVAALSSGEDDIDMVVARQIAESSSSISLTTGAGPGGSNVFTAAFRGAVADADPADKRLHARLNMDGLTCNLGVIEDFSLGGVRLRCKRIPNTIDAIVISSGDEDIELRCERVWHRRVGFRKHEVGLRFLNVTEREYRRMIDFAMTARSRCTFAGEASREE